MAFTSSYELYSTHNMLVLKLDLWLKIYSLFKLWCKFSLWPCIVAMYDWKVLMPLFFIIYNKLTPTLITFELISNDLLELTVFGSLALIVETALKLLNSKLFLFKRTMVPTKSWTIIWLGGKNMNNDLQTLDSLPMKQWAL